MAILDTGMMEKIRSYMITVGAPLVGFFVAYLLASVLGVSISKNVKSLLNLIVTSFFAFHIFPKVRGIPFGKLSASDFLKRLGLYTQENTLRYVILGIILSALTLSGMLTGSILSGLYVFDIGTIELSQIIFSINPGLWEELFYRGVLMVLLLRDTRSLKKAVIIQVTLFALFHVKGFELWSLVDVFSVSFLAVGFTYTAYKTRTLIPGIIFHFLHDSFVFVVQVSDNVILSDTQNSVFFLCLWASIGIGVLVTKHAADKLGVQEKNELYKIGE